MPEDIDRIGYRVVLASKLMIGLSGVILLFVDATFMGIALIALALLVKWTNDGKWFVWSEDATIPCRRCGGYGFSGYGTGYDDVCDWCGGYCAERYEPKA